jgi:hypothetical protein
MDDKNKKIAELKQRIAAEMAATPEQPTDKLQKYFHGKRGLIIFLVAISTLALAGVGAAVSIKYFYQDPELSSVKITPKPKQPPKYYSPLTGTEVGDPATAARPVTAIMIENSPDARPQSGLKDAGIIYEAVAEGGITRFVALYQEGRPALIGPVRSVRPYYVEWAAAYDASMAHVGGSSRALSMIRSGDYGTDLDQFFNASTYWRAQDRYAPHNVYTSFDKLDALNGAKGHKASTFAATPRADAKKADKITAQSIDIDVSTGYYTVHYDYLPDTNTYKRSEGGAPHTDREGGQLAPRVVIGIKVPMTKGLEDGYREQITTSGSGEADIFQNGIVIPATWHKTDPKAMMTFTDKDGKPITLARGQTWITAIANDRKITWQ